MPAKQFNKKEQKSQLNSKIMGFRRGTQFTFTQIRQTEKDPSKLDKTAPSNGDALPFS